MKTVGNAGRAIVVVFLVLGGPVVVVPAAEASRPTVARPLLVGNWADPTVCKDGADYYMTHSSFEFQPGLLIWHSKDLRSWRPITHAVVNQQGSIWAPDLIKHGGRYSILTSAQGGTSGPATSHMVVSARSKGPLGPWENSPHNPIIRTWDRDEAWWSKGHGTLVEGPGNNWYCALHGYMNGSFLLQVDRRRADRPATRHGRIQHDHGRLARLASGAVCDGRGKSTFPLLSLPTAG